MNTTCVRPGSQALQWLKARIAEIQRDDPLAPVTVVVSANHIGLATRRTLARSGYANVRFGVMGRLVEPLGAPALAAAGRSPLTLPAEEAAIVEALRRRGDGFGAVGAHPSLVRALRDLFRELRTAELDAVRLAALAAWGLMAEAALAVFPEYLDVIRAANLYDEQDLLSSATAALTGPQGARMVRELGAVLVHLPARHTPAETRFLEALAARTSVGVALARLDDVQADAPSRAISRALGLGWDDEATPSGRPPDVTLLAAPDAAEEVRNVVRRLLAWLESGGELGRIAIVYPGHDPYGPLVRDILDAAGVAWAGIDGRPLSESWAGRCLLGLLRLRDREFARVDVLTWLGALPEVDPGHVSIGDWDRLSRRAAVVRGARQWQDRLRLHAAGLWTEAAGMEHDGRSEGAIRHRRREAGALERMAAFIQRVESETEAPSERTWPALARWAEHVRRIFVPVAETWPEREREADEMIGELLTQMASAGVVEGEIALDRFVSAVGAALDARRQAEGRLGAGVAVGPIGALCGMELDLVFVVGATERAMPRPASPDPFFPLDGGPDPLGRSERRRSERRRDFLAAIAAADGGRVCLSFPAWDTDLRPSYPSPWLLEMAVPDGHRPVTASAVRAGRGVRNGEAVQSPDAGLRAAPTWLNVAEWRVALARADGSALSRSGLAARADVPLRRHLEVRAERVSDRFTEFDGNVEAEVGRTEHLAAGLDAARHSPSGVERWATCPFSYLLERVIGVEPTERPEREVAWAIGAAARGTLVHDILHRFLAELGAHGRPRSTEPYGAEDRRRIEEIAGEEFGRLEAAGATGHRLAWENERRGILADLQTFLQRDEELRGDGLVPTFFEQGFGMAGDSWAELVLDLGGGRAARLRGRIDRIDLGPDPAAPERARLIDYKTGRPYEERAFVDDALVAGTRVQPSVYAGAIRARHPGIRVDSGYWFVSARGNFRFLAVPDDQDRLSHVLDVVDRGLRAGAFPQVPGPDDSRRDRTSWQNCFHCAFDRICPTGRDQMRERKRDRPGPAIHLELGDAT